MYHRIEFRNDYLYFKVNGKGKPLVLLHGFLESSNMWDDFSKDLLNSFKIISRSNSFNIDHPINQNTITNNSCIPITLRIIFWYFGYCNRKFSISSETVGVSCFFPALSKPVVVAWLIFGVLPEERRSQ